MNISDALTNPIVTFSIIVTIALIIPEFLQRYKITAVPFYIISGIILGPIGLGMHLGDGLIFLGEVGLLFLIFIAGMEIYEMGEIHIKQIIFFTVISAAVCFAGGFLLGLGLGYSLLTAFLIGTILISSSIGEIIPMVNSTPSVKRRLSHIIFPSIVILDAASLILLGVIIKTDQPILQIVIFVFELALLIIISFMVLPKVLGFFFNRTSKKPKEGDLKFIIAILMIIVGAGYLIGVHGIVTAFIAGVIVGRHIPNQTVFDKIHGIGYGMLIPVFFIVLGMQLEVDILFKGTSSFILPILLILTLLISKLIGGIVFALIKKKPLKDGFILGMVIWPQLSATIAASAVGFETGLFNQEVLVSVVVMALFSALGTPFILRWFVKDETVKIDIKDHVIIAGYGRTTSKLIHMLEGMDFPIVIIDKSHTKLKDIETRGVPTIYGNAASRSVLKDARVKKARIAILSVSDEHDLYITARNIRKMSPSCNIIAKVHTEDSLNRLRNQELIDDYVWPEKRSASEISKKVIDMISQ
ncbi:MAG: cation:proton antiporter [Thermoplasmatota archaeon]